MGERIDRTRFGAGDWLPDGKSFLYPRLPKLPEGAPQTDLYLKNRVYKHVLGTNPDADKPVFGYGVNPEVVSTRLYCRLSARTLIGNMFSPWLQLPHRTWRFTLRRSTRLIRQSCPGARLSALTIEYRLLICSGTTCSYRPTNRRRAGFQEAADPDPERLRRRLVFP